MKINKNPRIWEFDVDDTIVLWDQSKYPDRAPIEIPSARKGHTALVIPHRKTVNLLVKLSKVGWYIRVHTGSGYKWGVKVIRALGLQDFVDEVSSKPLGRTDDKAPGDGLAYDVYRDPKSGYEK